MCIFDADELKSRLERLSTISRLIFAVTIAERLYPSYKWFCEKTGRGSADYVRRILDCLWSWVGRGGNTKEVVLVEDCECLLVDEDSEWSPLNPLSENAILALTYACQCFHVGDSDSAVHAAVQAYEAVDYLAHTLMSIKFSEPDAETRILNTDYVQDELKRQRRDLTELERWERDRSNMAALVDTYRMRARSEGQMLMPFVTALV